MARRRDTPRFNMSAPLCIGPGCDRVAWSKGLCHAHYEQQRRKKPLTPLRLVTGVKLPGVTVDPKVARQLARVNENQYAATKAALEEWAAGREETG